MSTYQESLSPIVQKVLQELNPQGGNTAFQKVLHKDVLYKQIQETLELLEKEIPTITEIDRSFFDEDAGFACQCDQTLISATDFFDSLMEYLSQEMEHPQETNSFANRVSSLFFKITDEQIEQTYYNLQRQIQTKLPTVAKTRAQFFVSTLSQFLDRIQALPVVCPVAAQEKNALLFKLCNAHRRFFLSAGSEWQETATFFMADTLEQWMRQALPTQEHIVNGLKHLPPIAIKNGLKKWANKEKKNFQEQLGQICQPLYQHTIFAITSAWQEYKRLYKERLFLLKRFLQDDFFTEKMD